ncbi:MAG: phosphocholine cytidylyltransferase family protein [Pseudomonadota bacterium]
MVRDPRDAISRLRNGWRYGDAMLRPKAIILAAGSGSRLGETYPKPLTRLADGTNILGRQIEALCKYIDKHDIYVVVGFKKEMIMEELPTLTFVYNERYHVTNTCKSLLAGLRKVRGNDVIWLNGDVVFEHSVIPRIVGFRGSCMGVNRAQVGEEAVKYRLREDGSIEEVSKEVKNPLGEALGINKIMAEHVDTLIARLEDCKDSDYFERGMERAIKDGLKIHPVDLSDLACIEVDDSDDLADANRLIEQNRLDR